MINKINFLKQNLINLIAKKNSKNGLKSLKSRINK